MRGLDFTNDATPIVTEYFERQTLAKLGYVFPSHLLTAQKADLFIYVEREIATLRAEIAEKRKPKGKRGRKG